MCVCACVCVPVCVPVCVCLCVCLRVCVQLAGTHERSDGGVTLRRLGAAGARARSTCIGDIRPPTCSTQAWLTAKSVRGCATLPGTMRKGEVVHARPVHSARASLLPRRPAARPLPSAAVRKSHPAPAGVCRPAAAIPTCGLPRCAARFGGCGHCADR
jgi:hypothetical protein